MRVPLPLPAKESEIPSSMTIATTRGTGALLLDFVPSPLTGVLGVLGFFAAVYLLNHYGPAYPLMPYWKGAFVMACTAVPMLFRDAWLVRRNSRSHFRERVWHRSYSWSRTATKLVGLVATCALLGLLYWIFPEYHDSVIGEDEFYSQFFALVRSAGPGAFAVCAVYFFWMDGQMATPRDGYWHFGRLVLLRWRGIDRDAVGNHLRTWAVKGFFFPLMFAYLCGNLPLLIVPPARDSLTVFRYLHNFLFTIDLAFVTCGYVLTLRWVQSHVRSAEPTALGWIAALICYVPFWNSIGDLFLGYWGDNTWDHWLTPGRPLFFIWGGAILVFETIFVWATVSFGLRFSNLTHRGIVRRGPYYFTKHPAYIAKICAFLLIAIPWLDSRGVAQSTRNCLMLAGLAFIYWIRSKTEERHLARVDATYALYAEEVRQRHRRWFLSWLALPERRV